MHDQAGQSGSSRDRYAIGIECSNPGACADGRGEVGLAKIAEDGSLECVGVRALPGSMRGSDGMMSAIDGLCDELGIGRDQIARVVVSVGPGGYTGLRVSVTLAKVLALGLGCAVVGVETAAVAAESVESDAIIALASKNGKAHCTRLENGELSVMGVIGAPEIAQMSGVLVADRHLPAPMREAAIGAGMRIEELRLGVGACFRASEGRSEVDPGALSVMYAREPDAVTQWRARHG
jgi:tRNA threonylcarbamoyl adenosine modification protein YeaZ